MAVNVLTCHLGTVISHVGGKLMLLDSYIAVTKGIFLYVERGYGCLSLNWTSWIWETQEFCKSEKYRETKHLFMKSKSL